MKSIIALTSTLLLAGILLSGFLQLEGYPKMVFIKGGVLKTIDKKTDQPITVKIEPFWIDKNLVTVTEFEQFVKSTGYKTDAERFGNSATFEFDKKDWLLIEGANYKKPFGPNAAAAEPSHPVTHVSWNDANAYARWKGKRLPYENEWEFAARNGGATYTQYTWGEKLVEKGKYKANTWQGNFPVKNTAADGFKTTSPIGYFGANQIGLTDMGGNVWQWCLDDTDPTPAEAQTDPSKRKVSKGGSFLCDPKVCHGFRVTGRSSSTPETSLSHTGFRCSVSAKDLP